MTFFQEIMVDFKAHWILYLSMPVIAAVMATIKTAHIFSHRATFKTANFLSNWSTNIMSVDKKYISTDFQP